MLPLGLGSIGQFLGGTMGRQGATSTAVRLPYLAGRPLRFRRGDYPVVMDRRRGGFAAGPRSIRRATCREHDCCSCHATRPPQHVLLGQVRAGVWRGRARGPGRGRDLGTHRPPPTCVPAHRLSGTADAGMRGGLQQASGAPRGALWKLPLDRRIRRQPKPPQMGHDRSDAYLCEG
ncbi:MAG: hypothetical protein KatS3mg027_0029 [Bacteroidia bacterium]|nr:MAG: hypothetical protein KatS3mg027_0029 [Bacteroidia bacterium]